jgi:phenylacetate-CoA ligase
MSLAQKLYARAPLALQNLGISTYGLWWKYQRFGPGFARHVAEIRARDRASIETPEEIERYTAARLAEVLAVAERHVPYYRERWSESERRAARAGDLTALPILTKEALRSEPPERFERQDRRPLRRLRFHTSGSTGTPLTTIWTRPELTRSTALREVRAAGWAGVSYRLPRATFSGRLVEPDPESSGPYYRYNRAERQVYFSAFHLGPKTARQYVAALERHAIVWLTGYTVSFGLLARYILEQGLAVPPLKAVVTTSERLTDAARATMEEAYGCPVFEEYGTVENSAFASQCPAGRLHLSPEAGVVEILRPDGTPADPGEEGEVVTTGLLRLHQPLVRYKIGDLARRSDEPCPCGRTFPVLEEVTGRIEDVVVGPDGRRTVRFHGLTLGLAGVMESQVVQETIQRLVVRVVATDEFGDPEAEAIRARVHERLGTGMEVAVERVATLERTARGKLPAVISRLTPEEIARVDAS